MTDTGEREDAGVVGGAGTAGRVTPRVHQHAAAG